MYGSFFLIPFLSSKLEQRKNIVVNSETIWWENFGLGFQLLFRVENFLGGKTVYFRVQLFRLDSYNTFSGGEIFVWFLHANFGRGIFP